MKQIAKILFSFFILFISSANAAEFDPFYTFTITYTHNHVRAPSIISNYWEASSYVNINNGISATICSSWNYESQAKQASKFEYSGNVNIIYSPSYEIREIGTYKYKSIRPFALVFQIQNKAYSEAIDSLYLYEPLAILGKVTSVTENIETINHWFSTEYRYRYVIQLDTGSKWLTESSSSPWENSWDVGSEVMLFGNCKQPILLNASEVRKKEYWSIDKEYQLVEYLP